MRPEDVLIIWFIFLIFNADVLISYRSTVRKHLYIAFGTIGAIVAGIILPPLLPLIIFCSTLWAAYDSYKLKVYQYQVGGVTNCLTVFLGCALAWPIFFTWHLVNRHMILDGDAKLKEKYQKSSGQKAHREKSKDIELRRKAVSPSWAAAEQPTAPKAEYAEGNINEVEDGHMPASASKPEPAGNSVSVIFCSGCGTRAIAGATFCEECGASLASKLACSECGHVFERTGKFCPQCGIKREVYAGVR